MNNDFTRRLENLIKENDKSSNLRFENSKNLHFEEFSPEGVTVSFHGFKYLISFLMAIKEDFKPSNEQLMQMSQAGLNFHCSVRNKPLHDISIFKPVESKYKCEFFPITKYVRKDIFENHIIKGEFQFGTIEQYRTIEGNSQRDEFEGYSMINMNINNQIIGTICNTGYNYLIFCGTSSKSDNYLKSKFGEREFLIRDVKEFAERIRIKLKAKRYFIQKVEYNTLKWLNVEKRIVDDKIDTKDLLKPPFFELLKKYSFYPSLFVKPEGFNPEKEVRIVFEMPRDQEKPVVIKDNSLLKLVSFP